MRTNRDQINEIKQDEHSDRSTSVRAARFFLAGGILYGWLRFKGVPRPSGFHWRNAAVVGGLLLGVGNGGVNWVEQKLASSLTALLIAITPLWFVLLDWLRPGGLRPSFQT